MHEGDTTDRIQGARLPRSHDRGTGLHAHFVVLGLIWSSPAVPMWKACFYPKRNPKPKSHDAILWNGKGREGKGREDHLDPLDFASTHFTLSGLRGFHVRLVWLGLRTQETELPVKISKLGSGPRSGIATFSFSSYLAPRFDVAKRRRT